MRAQQLPSLSFNFDIDPKICLHLAYVQHTVSVLPSQTVQILCVDDEPDLAEATAEMLEREHDRFTVETVTSADKGLDRLADCDFDCIVSDHDMPGQSGIEFLEAAREEHPDLPFILYTSKGSEEVASDAISAGVTDYLQKEGGTSQYALLAHRIEKAVESYWSQRTVERAEQKLSQLAEKTEDVLFMFSRDWSELLFVNSAFEDVWGVAVEELEANPQSFLEYVHPEDRERVRQSMKRLTSGEPDEIEYRVIRPDGEQRWMRGQSKPVFDEDGGVDRVVGFVRDITDRRERETKLERYETIVEALGDPVYVLDADGRYTFVNDAYVEATKYARDEMIGRHVSKVVPEEHRQRGGGIIRELLQDDTRQSTTWELERITADGDRIPVENHVALLPAKDGEFRGTAGVLRDISERKEREQELRQQNERLDKFASVVGHDLRNPLNVAQGRANLVRDECDSEHLEHATEAVDRSLAIIDDLLTLAREGEAVSDVEPVKIAAQVDDCWLTVETADATLVIETEQTIRAHLSRLKRLLENLFHNAVKHGGEHVTVTVGDLEDGFYICDDGPGIPDDEREQVFDAGYSTAESGTGFGLNIVQEIAEVHGWETRVTDSEAGGARFEITGVDVVSADG